MGHLQILQVISLRTWRHAIASLVAHSVGTVEMRVMIDGNIPSDARLFLLDSDLMVFPDVARLATKGDPSSTCLHIPDYKLQMLRHLDRLIGSR